MKSKKFLYLILLIFICLNFSISAQQIDDTRAIIQEHEKKIDLIKTNLDYVWVIVCAALVFFMQAGFMSLESGMARSKNSINVAIKNLTDFVFGVIGFWIIGFGLMFGKSWHGLFGISDFMISIKYPWTAAFFMFQAVFVGTAATIDSGAVCERAKLKQYIFLSFMLSIIIYPVFGHWAWGSFLHGIDPVSGGAGWLETRGFKDFAGSSVVHSVGGWMALAGAIVVGPRIGKFKFDKESRTKRPVKIPPGDMRFVFLGIFILFFTWYGFNCGSTLSATSDIAIIALNTTLAACFGCLSASLLSWGFHPEKKIEGDMIANGVLAGLVGITAGCSYVDTMSATIIGLVAGVVVFFGVNFIERVLKLDDVVGAIPVHAFCGVWGTLAVGIFIRPELLDGMTRFDQFKIQLIGVVSCFLWAFLMGLLFYFLVDKLLGGVRVTKKEEILGLNIAEHGAKSSILELATTIDEMTRTGEFGESGKVTVEKGTEIGDLAMLFNKMTDKVREALAESRNQKKIAEEMLHESEKQKEALEEVRKALEEEKKQSGEKRKNYVDNSVEKVSLLTDRIEGVKELMSQTGRVTENMSFSFENTINTLEKMLNSLNSVYSQLNDMEKIAGNTTRTVTSSKNKMDNLRSITKEIEEMVTLINSIAEKTHILSINSNIEATHAGDSGKGFVIISREVRKLSEQTTTAAGDIGQKLNKIEDRILNVSDEISNILNIMNDIQLLNKKVMQVINDNRQLFEDVQSQSSDTVKAVNNVAQDIDNVIKESDSLLNLGKNVRDDLKKID